MPKRDGGLKPGRNGQEAPRRASRGHEQWLDGEGGMVGAAPGFFRGKGGWLLPPRRWGRDRPPIAPPTTHTPTPGRAGGRFFAHEDSQSVSRQWIGLAAHKSNTHTSSRLQARECRPVGANHLDCPTGDGRAGEPHHDHHTVWFAATKTNSPHL